MHVQRNKSISVPVRLSGFTLVELLVVIAVIGVLFGLLMPSMRVSRDAARRMSCANNFKQVGLGIVNYHSAYQRLPMAMGTSPSPMDVHQPNANRLSGLVAVLPFVEGSSLWSDISNPMRIDGVEYPAMGPPPQTLAYDPWRTQIGTYVCPSSPAHADPLGLTSYTFVVGDAAEQIHVPDSSRGVTACRRVTRFSGVRDGLANTIVMSEIAHSLDDRSKLGNYAMDMSIDWIERPARTRELMEPDRPNFYSADVKLSDHGRGLAWADGGAGVSLVNTILPPNSGSLLIESEDRDSGFLSASSFHQGGCYVLMADGAVKFITDSIECGNQEARPPIQTSFAADHDTKSPYGLWGALGTAAGTEPIDNGF